MSFDVWSTFEPIKVLGVTTKRSHCCLMSSRVGVSGWLRSRLWVVGRMSVPMRHRSHEYCGLAEDLAGVRGALRDRGGVPGLREGEEVARRLSVREVRVPRVVAGAGSKSALPAATSHQESVTAGTLFHQTRKPLRLWFRATATIYEHQSVHFPVFICSELTDAAVRSSMRGRIDMLFVVEFNQDINSFSAIVEAACLDVHAFVVQCNNRRFGDSRVRSPASAEYRRDVVRLRGGSNDHLVIATLPIAALRAHQEVDHFAQGRHDTIRRPHQGEFKPTPDGFTLRRG